MQQFGLIGYPLSHSFSPSYFNAKFATENIAAQYNNYPIISVSEITQLIQNQPLLLGLNVTIPHKTSIIEQLDYISIEAKAIGAVNCIKIVDGKLYGFNTDCYGFTESLRPFLSKQIKKALILGSGGAAKAVRYSLTQLGIEFKIVSHSGKGDCDYTDLNKEIIDTHHLIINTTPIGMYPMHELSPSIPYNYLSSEHLLFDLIYNPELTVFLKHGLNQKCTVKNGLEMLHLQAEKSWDIWNSPQKEDNFIALR